MARHRPGLDLFLAGGLVLFLELAFIRWVPAHVLFLSFFTNVMLLAGFVGMSVGCLLARRPRRQIAFTPYLVLAVLLAGLWVEGFGIDLFATVVGDPSRPEVVYFGTEDALRTRLEFRVPVELVAGAFFLLVAAALVGPGQELGRAFNRVADRTAAYTFNLLGSVAGIGLFAAFSLLHLPPVVWFAVAAAGVGYFLLRPEPDGRRVRPLFPLLALALVVPAAAVTSVGGVPRFSRQREVFWSPYYRVDYVVPAKRVETNQTGHQAIEPVGAATATPYDLPYLLRPELTDPAAAPRILVIGAGTGNDLARALHWCGPNARVDAVEIDPVIRRLGDNHPDQPYADGRLTTHLNDGRNFLRTAPAASYDLVVFALVDSLVLHSGYSSLRLESYLFTAEAFADVRRVLKPTGTTAVYNFFRHGWIMARLREELETAFAADPLVLLDRRQGAGDSPAVKLDDAFLEGGGAVLFGGGEEAVAPLRAKFAGGNKLWVPGRAGMSRDLPGVFAAAAPARDYPNDPRVDRMSPENVPPVWVPLSPAELERSAGTLRPATDDWPFLYARRPELPPLTWNGVGLMLLLSACLWAGFHALTRRPPAEPLAATDRRAEAGLMLRAFLLGGGFMLIETKAVVQMALLFGSTWVVNTVVFAAVLLVAVAGNLFAGRVKPRRLEVYYSGLFVSLAVGFVLPLGWLLGLPPVVQVLAGCGLAFAPVLFAGVIFPTTFARTARPDWFFAANAAGALVGGLAENASVLVGFQGLLLVAAGFYALSAAFGGRAGEAGR